MRTLLVLLLALVFCSVAGAWTHVSTLPGPLKQLELDPNHPDVLFAVTGEALFRSVDGGRNWIKTDLRGNGQIVVHPKDSRIYAIFDDVTSGAVTSRTLWISKNQGVSFQLIRPLNLLHDPLPLRIFIDRYHVDWLYATDRDSRLMGSTDGGKHWRFLHVPDNLGYVQIYNSPVNPQVIYLSGFRPGNYISGTRVLLISHNRGKDWRVLSRREPPCVPTHFYEDSFFNRILVSDCEGTKTLATGRKTRSNVLRVFSIVSVAGSVNKLVALQQVQERDAQNLLMSDNGGDTWQRVDGLNGSISHVQVLNDAGHWVVAATGNGGIYRQRLNDFVAGGSARAPNI